MEKEKLFQTTNQGWLMNFLVGYTTLALIVVCNQERDTILNKFQPIEKI
jgi:hypothetical protein